MIISIAIATFFLFVNLLVPLFLYHRRFGLFKRRYQGRGGCNGWSLIMDGLAAGMINLMVTKYLLEVKAPLLTFDLMTALLIGLVIMISAHIWMSYRKWEIWIMNKPGKWNEGGYWHMISMTLQMSFLAYFLIILWQNEDLGFSLLVKTYFWWGLLGTFLFLWSFRRSDRDLKISRFTLKSRAW